MKNKTIASGLVLQSGRVGRVRPGDRCEVFGAPDDAAIHLKAGFMRAGLLYIPDLGEMSADDHTVRVQRTGGDDVVFESAAPAVVAEAFRAAIAEYRDWRAAHPETPAPAVQVRTYRNAQEYARDAAAMAEMGYFPRGQIMGDQKVAVGRTLAKGVATGGVGLLLTGRSKKGGEITVTYVREEGNQTPLP